MKKYMSCFLLFFLFGCSAISFNVELKTKTIEYEKEEIDICQYIKKIDGTNIREFNVSENKIMEKDFEVSCTPINVRKLGKQETTIMINGVEVIVNFEVKDTKAPTITIKSEELQVEEGNEYFDLKSLIKVNDAYDKNPTIGYTGEYDLSKSGTYTVVVTAVDSSKNKASKKIKINVDEKEVKIVERESATVLPNTTTNENNSVTSNRGSTNQVVSSLARKEFLFVNGFDLMTGFDACMNYKGNNVGACEPLQGSDGLPYGYVYLP